MSSLKSLLGIFQPAKNLKKIVIDTMAGAKRKKGAKYTDFIGTISDSETNNVPNLDEVNDDKKNVQMNPNFVFDAGDDLDTGFEGWDLDTVKEDKKSVDLDNIIRRRGGLMGKVIIEDKKKDDDEEDDADDDEDEESDQIEQAEEEKAADELAEEGDDESDDTDGSDDDELALDGFGMGAPIAEEDDDEDEDEDEEQQEEQQEEQEETVPLEANGSDISDSSDSDSEEAVNNFYDTAEGENSKKILYKDFQSMKLSRPVLKGLAALGYTKPTPIQSASIPISLMGKDVVAGAQTGSGKTAAYMIPIIERLLYKPSKVPATRVVVMAPTRELALQVADVGKKIAQFVGGISIGLAIGGLNLRQQEQQLKTRPDIVIATPGRFIDHIRNSPSFSVDMVEIMVLDEADRMLEEGFHDEISEILELLPQKRQTMLFSATMNSHIKDMIQLSLDKPVRIMIDPPKASASGLLQEFCRIRKREELKPALLYDIISKVDSQKRVIVFVATKALAHKLRIIVGLLGLRVSELHGALTQEQRLKSITDFKKLDVPVLICTDLAARGLDIPKIEVVVNYDMPKSHEIYLHRVGRTARAGREGISISFVGESTKERKIVKEVIASVASSGKGKVVGRKINWPAVDKISKLINTKKDMVEEIMDEEQAEKEMLHAEMELQKSENVLRYQDEIHSRPRRTWFQSEDEKRRSKTVSALGRIKKKDTRKDRKKAEDKEDGGGRSYKKTKNDRIGDYTGKTRHEKLVKKRKAKHDRREFKKRR